MYTPAIAFSAALQAPISEELEYGAETRTSQPSKATIEIDQGADGSVEERTTALFSYENGHLVRGNYHYDDDGDGVIDGRSSGENTYDANGNLVTSTLDFGRDRLTSTFAYDDNNRIISAGTVQRSRDGEIIFSNNSALTYTDGGNTVKTLTRNDIGGDGSIDLTASTVEKATFNGDGNLTMVLVSSDINNDGTPDIDSKKTYTYSGGRLTFSQTEISAQGVSNSKSTTTYTYDSEGRIQRIVSDDDYDADGSIDERMTLVYDYGGSGSTDDESDREIGGGTGRKGIREAGSRRNDRLKGTANDDTLIGKAGNDRLCGLGGNDVLVGGGGNDRLKGNNGDDILRGGQGRDRLLGGRGNDRLIGGPDTDLLVGGQGSDSFVLRRGKGFDVVKDFEDGSDRIDLPGALRGSDLTLEQRGRNLMISNGSDELALLRGVNAADLTAADFT